VENDKPDAIAGGEKPASDDLSEAALVALWETEVQETDEPETPEEEAEVESEEEPEAEEAEELEEEESEEEPEGVDALDLDSLTDEQWEVVRTKLKSRAAADIQSLKRENRAKDETIAALQAQQPQTVTAVEPVKSRFLEGVDNDEKLAEQVTRLKKLTKDIRTTLRKHADYGINEPFQVDGETFTRGGLEDLRDEVEEALTEAVPSKQAEFRRIAESEQLLETAKAEALSRVPALADEKSEVTKNFKAVTESPNFKKLFEAFPESRPMLHLMAALAVGNASKGKTEPVKAPVTTGTKPKAKPPSTPSGVAVQPAAKSDAKTKRIQEARRRYEENPTQENLIKLGMAEES